MATDLKIKLPFHQRLFIYAIILFGAFLLCFICFQYKREKAYKADLLNYRLQIVNTHIADALEESKDIDFVLDDFNNDDFENLRITIIDTTGVVSYDSQYQNFEEMGNHANRPEFIEAMQSGMGRTVRRLSESTNREYFYSATLSKQFVIRTALPYNLTLREVLSADGRFIWFMISIAIIISFVVHLITSRLGNNIAKLKKFALTTARGESVEDLGEFPKDELGEISSQVIRLYTELKHTKERLEGEHQLVITHEHEKAQLKKQLTQNINHELKTPVSGIKGYLEIIMNNPNLSQEKKAEFIEKSYTQVERLTQLLTDISTITRMDEASDMIDKANVDLNLIIREVLTAARPNIEQAGVIVECNFGPNLGMYGNQSLLHSLFANLTDNALAYSGCSKIEIKVTDAGDLYRICFSDNGIGIAKEHFDRIFERFYRIDKGRSRKLGGTGLGLSIVKNAVMIHCGAICVQERQGGGTAFIFTLRKL